MGIVLLSLFIICEIGLVIFTSVKETTKGQWKKYRLIAHGAEIAIFLILLLTPLVDMNIRFKLCFVILLIRLVIGVIAFLVGGKKTGEKKIGVKIISLILNIVVLFIAVSPSLIFANYNGLQTTGSHKVASTSFIIVDEDRYDPFEGIDSKREVPVYAFYPEDGGKENEYPLVLFSHGAFGYYQSNMSAYEELASNGYVVLALDHPHHSFVTTNTKGQKVTVDKQFVMDVAAINGTDVSKEDILKSAEWLELRKGDVNTVLDEFKAAKSEGSIPANWFTEGSQNEDILNVLNMADSENIGLFGHSLGGATAVSIGRERDDINAVIDLDGTMLGEELGYENGKYIYIEESYPVPLLSLVSEIHYNEGSKMEDLYVNNFVCDNAVDARTIYIKGTAHMNFTDLPLFSPFLGSLLGVGSIDSEKCIIEVNGICKEFFDYYLKGEGTLDLKECYE